MKRILIVLSIILLGIAPGQQVKAQTPAIQVIDGTVSISPELRTALETYLNTYPPADVPFYAPTYAEELGNYWFVSLAGLDLSSPDEPWGMEAKDDNLPVKVAWIGTVRIYLDGTGELYSAVPDHAQINLALTAMATLIMPAPGRSGILAAGGGSDVRFPFQLGKSMMYGPRLVHGEGDYGTSGMRAVDLVGGTSMGTNVANDIVYASGSGHIDYVCTGTSTIAVRTYDGATHNYWLYAHLLPNSSLEISHVFAAGSPIASLMHGPINDSCGWADQAASQYHVHWMFEPAGGAYKVGSCTLMISEQKWHCGSDIIGSGGWLTNNASGTGEDDPSGGSAPSIFDNIVMAIVTFSTGTANLMPAHNSPGAILRGVINTVVMFFRLAWILLRGNLNLAPIAIIFLFLIAERTGFGIIWLVFWVIRVIRLLKQTIFF